MKRKPKANGQAEPFIPRPAEVLASPAFRFLPPASHLILACLELKWSQNWREMGRETNGRLLVTYRDFAAYGCGAFKRISKAIHALEQARIIEVTERGERGPGHRHASTYRVTYLPTATQEPTHDWKIDSQPTEADQGPKTSRPHKAG